MFSVSRAPDGKEQLIVQSFESEPGACAYVTFKESRGEKKLDAEKPCYPFKVE